MTWTLTDDLDEYLATAEPFLAEDPVTETVLLTLARSLRVRGVDAFGDDKPLMGWWTGPDGSVEAALVQLPTRPLFLSRGPAEAVDAVDELLARYAHRIPQIRVSAGQEDAISVGVLRRTGKAPTPYLRNRLYRLGQLVVPTPMPAGSAELPADEDLELTTEWYGAFCTEVGEPDTPEQLAAQTRERIDRGEIRLWRRPDGVPVAMAALSAPIESMSRISLVYTPKDNRRRGYAGAVTATLCQIAIESGIEHILLFTDLANPTSNALYQRIGFQQVSDAVVLTL
ncbi:MAG TPA: GNAT family N-acetyltransferase [Actinocrinis sp.]|nr:GNAT family N-acetyltransferase [Actinocrinis sp.]